MASLSTGWLRVATAGETIDGREIKDEWIDDMVETYSLNTYGALIWPEHCRWFGNYGEVLALKKEIENGKKRLYARLKPNKYLLSANKDDQLLYFSIEPEPNFQGTGKTYLLGLAVTDNPASIGTDRLRFRTSNSQVIASTPEPFNLSDLRPKKQNQLFTDNQPEGDTQMEELKALIEALTARITAQEAKSEATDQAIEDVKTETEAVATAVEEVKTEVEEVKTEVSSEEFKVMKSIYLEMSKRTTTLPNGAPANNKAIGSEINFI